MTRCPYCLNSYMNVNPAHLIKHDKRLSDVRVEFPGWDLGKCITLCKPCHRSINWHEADYVEQFKAKIKIIDSSSIKG